MRGSSIRAAAFWLVAASLVSACSINENTAPADLPASHAAVRGLAARTSLAGAARIGTIPLHVDRSPSRMSPDAKKNHLVYISDGAAYTVHVYSYPQFKPMGLLSGFNEPQGLCNDNNGNVYVANTGGLNIVEYAHGASTPINTLTDSSGYPAGCAVNPKNGDLAVSNIAGFPSGDGSIALYCSTCTRPKTITVPHMASVFFVTYDAKGTLYADGQDSGGAFRFASMNANHTFKTYHLDAIAFPGGLIGDCSWCGCAGAVAPSCSPLRVIIGDQSLPSGGSDLNVTQKGKIEATIALNGSNDVIQAALIHGKIIVAPDAGNGSVEVYTYPGGGDPIRTLAGFYLPEGATFSK